MHKEGKPERGPAFKQCLLKRSRSWASRAHAKKGDCDNGSTSKYSALLVVTPSCYGWAERLKKLIRHWAISSSPNISHPARWSNTLVDLKKKNGRGDSAEFLCVRASKPTSERISFRWPHPGLFLYLSARNVDPKKSKSRGWSIIWLHVNNDDTDARTTVLVGRRRD